MNELYVSNGYLYFKTKENSAETAVNQLIGVLEKVGVELIVENAVLRDENGNDIENMTR